MDFDLPALLAQRAGQGYELQDQYLKPNLSRMLHVIGFDKVYEKAEGGYLYDRDGNRYADFLTGFGVFGMGRNHPVIRKALHDLLDSEVADLVQFDCALLPGLLAERLLAKAPGLDRAYFSNSGTEAVETALKFARYATGKPRILYCDHAFHGLTLGSLSVNGSAEFRRGFDPLLPDSCIPLGDLDALARELRKWDVAGQLSEPIQVRCSSATRSRPGSAGPAGSWPTSTRTCSRTSSRSRRRCPAGSSRWAPRWPRTGSSRRSTPRWTGRSCTTRRSATTRRR